MSSLVLDTDTFVTNMLQTCIGTRNERNVRAQKLEPKMKLEYERNIS